MTFQQAMIEWRGSSSKATAKKLDTFFVNAKDHPRLWRMAENMVLSAYERDTGERLVGKIDWNTIFDWLTENGPAILKMILSLITMFGG